MSRKKGQAMIPTCRELTDFLDDYVEGRLSLARRVSFEVHLAMCRDCRRYLASYRRTIALAKNAGAAGSGSEADSPPMPAKLVEAILEARKRGDFNNE
jgi:anti-sigma factor RsiW